MSLSEKAQLLHQRMLEQPPGHLFDQEQLQRALNVALPVELLKHAQELINNKLLKLIKQGDELKFQAISAAEALKISAMSDDEAMIYLYIEALGREGIWTKTIKAKTNLHQHIVVRCLKALENQRYIKLIKSVKHPTRKIYMLYNLQPLIEVTGGPWFTDSELDTEFIELLLTVIWRFVALKLFPTAFQPPLADTHAVQLLFAAHHPGFISLDAIMEFIAVNKITNIDLATHDVRLLCDVLVFDDKLELVPGTVDTYKATWQSVLEAGYGQAYTQDATLMATLGLFYEAPGFLIFEAQFQEQHDSEELVYLDLWLYD
jgi:DNA-directed RNA polymerase III subunit RPC6